MPNPHRLHSAVPLFLALLVLSACDNAEPAGLAPDDPLLAASAAAAAMQSAALSADIQQQVAALRRLTAPFHDIETAEAAGWDFALTPCLSSSEGGMGVHMANLDLLDGTAELLGPETLLYEPQKNGRMRLVAIEYLVPFSILPSDADPPELLGQHFHQNLEAGVWALHVWLWRHNPAGLFADFNQNVTCDWAD